MEEFANENRRIAYFSMEIALEPGMNTYSGGLGILAGDTIKSCADLAVPVVAVTLLHKYGHFRQVLDQSGNQFEYPDEWDRKAYLQELPNRIKINIGPREVKVGAWRYDVKGIKGNHVPVYFLDTDLEGNCDFDRSLTGQLYGGDNRYRFCQEIVLGIAGVRMLETLGYSGVQKYHMNEGHSSLLALELLKKEKDFSDTFVIPGLHDPVEAVRAKCIFTTHTPVPAGHDRINIKLVRELLDCTLIDEYSPLFLCGDEINMTTVGLNFSHFINGVAKRHAEVSRKMFPGYDIDAITNGIHPATWAAYSFQALFDAYVNDWKTDHFSLRRCIGIPDDAVYGAHLQCKKALIDEVNKRTGLGMDYSAFTVGFARRATAYKRADMVLSDIERLCAIQKKTGSIQIVYAGKAHPKDNEGKELIKNIFSKKNELSGRIKIAYLDNYEMNLAKLLVSGADLWLNTPDRPREASGTSGMKAALNGVPSLSIIDGWWVEGLIENVTGWGIGASETPGQGDRPDAEDLYEKLEKIAALFYSDRTAWVRIMKQAIAINGSYFNTHRMVQEYVFNAYWSEKRRHFRMEANSPLVNKLIKTNQVRLRYKGHPIECSLMDISIGGAAIVTSEPLPTGSEVFLTLCMSKRSDQGEPSESRVEFRGQITRRCSDPDGLNLIGINFTGARRLAALSAVDNALQRQS